MEIHLSDGSLCDYVGFDTHPTEKRIRSFSSLEAGWHYGEGVEFNLDVQDAAISLNALAVKWGLIATDAFPGIDGGILLTICHREHYLEFRVEPDCAVSFCRELNDGETEDRPQLSLDEAKRLLTHFGLEVCWQSEPSTSGIFTQEGNDLPQRLSSDSGMAFPSSTTNAPWGYPATCADTYDASTSQEPRASRQSIGHLIPEVYLLATG